MTKTATRVERKSRKQSTSALESTDPIATMGDATTAIFLLSDYEKCGLSERVSQVWFVMCSCSMFHVGCFFRIYHPFFQIIILSYSSLLY
jgi:hypothetical protein